MSNHKPANSAGTPPQKASKQASQRPASNSPGTKSPGTKTAQAQRNQTHPNLVKPAPRGKVRRAQLQVFKLDPWSVLKMAFLLSVALGIVTVVAAVVLWGVLDLTGVFGKVNEMLNFVGSSSSGDESALDVREYVSLGQVASFATILAVVNVVLLTILATLASVLYNISSSLVGGIAVTLTDD